MKVINRRQERLLGANVPILVTRTAGQASSGTRRELKAVEVTDVPNDTVHLTVAAGAVVGVTVDRAVESLARTAADSAGGRAAAGFDSRFLVVEFCHRFAYNTDMNTIDDILAAALALPSEDRARLIPLLWDQVSPEDWSMPSAAWIAESNRRSELVDIGEMNTDDWENVRARARRQAGLPE